MKYHPNQKSDFLPLRLLFRCVWTGLSFWPLRKIYEQGWGSGLLLLILALGEAAFLCPPCSRCVQPCSSAHLCVHVCVCVSTKAGATNVRYNKYCPLFFSAWIHRAPFPLNFHHTIWRFTSMLLLWACACLAYYLTERQFRKTFLCSQLHKRVELKEKYGKSTYFL